MKSARSETLKRDINLVVRGFRNGTKVLFRWVNQAGDKEKTKKRVVLVLAVPASLFVIGSEYPGPVLAAGLLAFLGVSMWFAQVEVQEMSFDPVDFLGPFEAAGRVMDFSELLTYVAREYPGESLDGLGLLLQQDFGSPRLTGPQIAYQLRRIGVRHPALGAANAAPSPDRTALTKEANPVENFSEAAPERSSLKVEVSKEEERQEDSPEQESEENPQFTETAPNPSPDTDAQEGRKGEPGQGRGAGSSVMEKVRGRVQGMLG